MPKIGGRSSLAPTNNNAAQLLETVTHLTGCRRSSGPLPIDNSRKSHRLRTKYVVRLTGSPINYIALIPYLGNSIWAEEPWLRGLILSPRQPNLRSMLRAQNLLSPLKTYVSTRFLRSYTFLLLRSRTSKPKCVIWFRPLTHPKR